MIDSELVDRFIAEVGKANRKVAELLGLLEAARPYVPVTAGLYGTITAALLEHGRLTVPVVNVAEAARLLDEDHTKLSQGPVVHLLRPNGKAPCWISSQFPSASDWPEGNTGTGNFAEVTCQGCILHMQLDLKYAV